MTLRCGIVSRCMANPPALLQQCRKPSGPLTSTGWKPVFTQRTRIVTANFSSTRTCELRIRRSGGRQKVSQTLSQRPKYPGFRQESPEHRLIRENRLFDPYEGHGGDVDRLRALQESKHGGTLPLKLTTTSELEREMIWSATRAERGRRRALKILSILLSQRAQERKTVHYETLIALNTSPDKGSAANMKSLLQEMDQQNIACDVNAYTSILRSLVVHPDIEVLDQVLNGVASSWIELDVEMLHYTTAIYIRLDMPEIALDYLDRIEGLSTTASFATRTDQSKIQSGQAELWLYVLLINHLAARRDWEGVLRICHRLNDDTSLGPFGMRQLDIPYAFWERLLYRSAKHHDLWLTLWIWNTWVVRDWFRPAIKVCAEVLKTFMRHELKDQAFGAIKILKTFGCMSGEKTVSVHGRSRSNAERRKTWVRKLSEYLVVAEKQLGITKPSDEQTRIAAHWLAFQHDSHSKVFASAGLRINPWSVLPKEGADPGELWARIANERREEDLYASQLRKLHDLQEKETATRASVSEALSALPSQLRADANKLVEMDFDLRYRRLRLKRLEADTALQVPAEEEEEEEDGSLDFDEGHEVEFIDYEIEDSFGKLLQQNPFDQVEKSVSTTTNDPAQADSVYKPMVLDHRK